MYATEDVDSLKPTSSAQWLEATVLEDAAGISSLQGNGGLHPYPAGVSHLFFWLLGH